MINAKVVAGILSLFVVLPLWLWLMYQILVRVQASELMWFLYWVYVPAAILTSIFARIGDD